MNEDLKIAFDEYFELIKDPDLYDQILYIYKKLNDNNIKPSSVFRINLKNIKRIVNLIPDICADTFSELLHQKNFSENILLFNNIVGADKLLNGEAPPKEN